MPSFLPCTYGGVQFRIIAALHNIGADALRIRPLERKSAMIKSESDAWRLQSILDSTHLGTWEWNVQTGETIFNDIWAQIIGYTLDELAPVSIKTWETLAHPDDIKLSAELLKRHFAGELPYYDIECRLKHKDGHWVWIHDRGKVVSRTADGKPLMMFGTHADITARKQAEEALRESEERFSILSEAAFEGIVISDRGRVLDANEQLARMFGYTRSEMTGLSVENFVAPESRELVLRHILSGSEEPYEHLSVRKDGSFFPVEIRAKSLSYKGRAVRVTAVRDCTKRKEAEAKEQSITNILNETGEMAKIGGWELDLVTGISTWTKETYRIFEVDPSVKVVDEIPKKPKGVDYYAPEFRPIIGQAVRRTIEYGEPYDLEVVLITEKGNRRWVRTNGRLNHRNGHAILAGTMQDITERKLAEDAIAAEKERLAVTLRSIGDGVITTDTVGHVVIMNKVAELLCGWTQEEAQGKPLSSVFNIINESTRAAHENPVEKVLSTGQSIELANHTLLISRDGTERIIADSGAPIKDKNNKTIGVVLVFRDMTEKRKLTDTMHRAQKLESLGVLAGGIAHDFNNLMGGIFGYIDLANCDSDKGRSSEYLSKAMATIDRARGLTSQLLTFAKGGAPIQKTDHLFPFVQETAQFALSGANVSCNFDVQKDLWVCNFDKNQIGQVIDNLIINAQQAMPVGGTIKLSARNITIAEKEHPTLVKDNYIKISVNDSGIGIPKELITRIFDPFFTTKAKGHGLGLATCYSIINRHGGCIDVESEPGKGSTFHIYLPASTDSVSVSIGASETGHKGSGTFLIMDDKDVIQETICIMLESFGYTVVCTANGSDAVDYFTAETKANRTCAGIIFDLTVPGGMGGKAAVAEIRKSNIEIPVFVASGYAEDPVMKNPAKYGFTASICKPFRRIELIAMLNKYMQAKK
jgi:PAS domain S-box-containing protein